MSVWILFCFFFYRATNSDFKRSPVVCAFYVDACMCVDVCAWMSMNDYN